MINYILVLLFFVPLRALMFKSCARNRNKEEDLEDALDKLELLNGLEYYLRVIKS